MSFAFFRRLSLGLLVVTVSACASNRLAPVTVSSANVTGYSLRYADTLGATVDGFVSHKKQLHELASSWRERAPQAKPNEDWRLLLRVIDEADADGRREASVRARRADRGLLAFWESERAPIGTRVASAVQKQASDAGCTQLDSQAAVQQPLREGVARQLEKRVRSESEAQRVLELFRAQLSAATVNALQRSADEVSLASYLAYVGLVEDVSELERLRRDHEVVVATLQRALAQERALQTAGAQPKEIAASQARVAQLTNRLNAVTDAKSWADKELSSSELALQQARSEYQQAYAALRFALPPHPAPTSAR